MTFGGDRRQLAGVCEGEVLAGKYRVDRVLGAGGMGIVVAAQHLQLDEKVAIKLLLPDALANPEAAERFLREARASVKIKSEHVVSVKDVGTLPSGAPYIVMEYLEGTDLAGWIKQRGALPIDQAVEFVIQACVAVAEAHALRIVHRDLKPANLFCVRRADGQLSIKVLDFGISKVTDVTGTGAGVAMTRTSVMMGTPLYMSPEQMRSAKDVDGRTDIWALGAILFELIAGRPPFQAETLMDLGFQIASEPPPPLRAFRPDAPGPLEASILKCMEKDPLRRYPNVGELALAILPYAPKRAKAEVERISGIIQAAGLSASALAVPASPLREATLVADLTLRPIGRSTIGATRGKSAAWGAGLVVALLAAAGVTLAVRTWRGASDRGVEGNAASVQAAGPTPPATPSVSPTTSATEAPRSAAAATPPPPAASAMLPAPAASPEAPDTPQAVSSPIRAPGPGAPGGPQPGLQPAHGAALVRSPPAVVPEPRPAATTVKPAAADCTIPFTIDSRGHRVPKPECL